MRYSNERGIAMITTLLVLMLMSALLVGFTTVVMSDQRYRFIDRDRGQAFYGAAGGVEKLTADLGNLFYSYVAPSGVQVTALVAAANLPVIPRVTLTAASAPSPLPASSLSPYKCIAPKVITTVGANGYTISFCADAAGNPTTIFPPTAITTGPYQGLIAEQTPYQLDVTAQTTTGGEVHLVRTIEAVAIPVFQFGMFSDVDLSFFAGPNFDFGGRVHTNGNLFLAQGSGNTLTLRDKVTALKEVIRQQLQNGVSIDTPAAHAGIINMASSSTTFRNLARTEGSVLDGPLSGRNEPTWHTISLSIYNSYIRNGRTGVKRLDLPLILPSVGGSNPDLVRRPPATEVTTSVLYNERLFSKASLRILLSDTAADITSIPGVSAVAPVSLETNWNAAPPAGYGPVTVAPAVLPALAHPPAALSPGFLRTAAAIAVAGVAPGTITFGNAADAALFKPTFAVVGNPGTVTCDAKTTVAPWQLTTCVGWVATLLPVAVTAISPAGGASGATATTSLFISNSKMEFANQLTLDRFNVMPMWDANTNTLISCTGFAGLTYTNCSPMPAAGDVLTSAVVSNAGTSTLGGFIKIEVANTAGVWSDVTTQILGYGIGAANDGGTNCGDPTQYAIVRLQRLRDNGGLPAGCNYNLDNTGAKDPTNWWPYALFDTREGVLRDTNYPGTLLPLSGVMYYVALDAGNLAKWFRGAVAPYIGGSGNTARVDNTGYTVYFSDRRNNRNELSQETAEFGWDDFINPLGVNGAPNAALDTGEDVNGNGVLDLYGGHPNYNGVYDTVPPCTAPGCPAAGAANTLNLASRPTTQIARSLARVNRPILFRRALMLMNGAVLAPTINGLTVASENPVYVRGDWNVNGGNFAAGVHAATSVIGDAVTLLSNNWIDGVSFSQPYARGNRNRLTQTWYRMAIIGGKGVAFPQPGGTPTDFGTDGGVHNFLRYLENGDQPVNYLGSIATFFYNRQAVGTYKCCTTVYGAPVRNYVFDIDFLDPAKLPPNTPVFRDMNAVGFSQELRPGK